MNVNFIKITTIIINHDYMTSSSIIIDPSQVEDVIKDRFWPSLRTAFDGVHPCIWSRTSTLYLVLLWYITDSGFAFAPLKVPTLVCTVHRMQTFFLGFPCYKVRAASPHFSVEQLALLFH